MTIPFYQPSIGAEEINEVVETLKSGWLTTGPRTKQFEGEFADYLKQKHAIAVNSCTAALHLALEAIGLKAGQGVIVPTMTFAATAEVVRYFDARPILADCRIEDFNLDVADAERKIEAALAAGQSVAAIMPVHYGGQIGDVAGVRALANRYHLKIIEDAAHCCPAYYRLNSKGEIGKAESRSQECRTTRPQDQGTKGLRDHKTSGLRNHGTTGLRDPGSLGPWVPGSLGPWVPGSLEPEVSGPAEAPLVLNDRQSTFNPQLSTLNPQPTSDWLPVGTGADISCYSFYANKTITTGEGGMACTEDDQYADRMRIMSLHGISRDAWKRFTAEGSWYYEILQPGFKYNLTDIAAAIGIHQVRKANQFHERRTALANAYTEQLAGVEELVLPTVQPDRIHSWHLYVVRLKLDRLTLDRAGVIAELNNRGIRTSVHWMPLHMHPYYRDAFGYQPQDLPMAARLYQEIITLPLYPGLTDEQLDYICDSLKEIIARHLVGQTILSAGSGLLPKHTPRI